MLRVAASIMRCFALLMYTVVPRLPERGVHEICRLSVVRAHMLVDQFCDS